MALLDRNKLLVKRNLKVERVDLPDGDHVFVRQWTAREKDNYEQSLMKEVTGPNGPMYLRDMDDYSAKLAVQVICDEQGNLLLKKEDYKTLSQNMDGVTINKIVDAAQKLNRVTEVEKEKLAKNLKGGQDAASNSASA